MEAANRIDQTIPTLVVSFNKRNAEELKERMPNYIASSTLNALGFRLLRRRFSKIDLQRNKVRGIAGKVIKGRLWETYGFGDFCVALVEFQLGATKGVEGWTQEKKQRGRRNIYETMLRVCV